jgi:hypothetical protein
MNTDTTSTEHGHKNPGSETSRPGTRRETRRRTNRIDTVEASKLRLVRSYVCRDYNTFASSGATGDAHDRRSK